MNKRQPLGPNADELIWRKMDLNAMRDRPASSKLTILHNHETNMAVAETGRNALGEVIKKLTKAGIEAPECSPKKYSSTD